MTDQTSGPNRVPGRQPPVWQESVACSDVLGRAKTVFALVLIRRHPIVVRVPAGETAHPTLGQASRLAELLQSGCARIR